MVHAHRPDGSGIERLITVEDVACWYNAQTEEDQLSIRSALIQSCSTQEIAFEDRVRASELYQRAQRDRGDAMMRAEKAEANIRSMRAKLEELQNRGTADYPMPAVDVAKDMGHTIREQMVRESTLYQKLERDLLDTKGQLQRACSELERLDGEHVALKNRLRELVSIHS